MLRFQSGNHVVRSCVLKPRKPAVVASWFFCLSPHLMCVFCFPPIVLDCWNGLRPLWRRGKLGSVAMQLQPDGEAQRAQRSLPQGIVSPVIMEVVEDISSKLLLTVPLSEHPRDFTLGFLWDQKRPEEWRALALEDRSNEN